jgi:hypothetical protein
VEQDVADPARAELGEDGVEPPAAVAERVAVGAVAERNDAVLDVREVRPGRDERLVELLRVVGDVALAVGRGADEKEPAGAARPRRARP